MSLINQMLKDIESRSRQYVKPETALAGLYASQAKKNIFNHWKIITSILLILFLVTFTTKIFLSYPHIKNFPAILKTIHVKAPLAINKNVPSDTHITPSVLTGITFQIQQNMTSLRFLLTKNVLYRVNYDKKTEKLIIFLDHSHLIAGLPPINYQHSAVKNMQIFNSPTGDLKIILSLNPNTEVKQLGLNDKSKYPELILELFLPDTEVTDAAEQTPTISSNNKSIKKLLVNMTAEEQYNKALSALSLGNDQQAIRLLRDIVENYPEYYLARESLAKLWLQFGNKKSADRLLEVGLRLQPTYIPFIELRARILVDDGKIQEALSILQNRAPSIEENPDYYSFIAALYQRQGEAIMAAKMYEQLLHLDSNKAVWWVGLGIALETMHKHSEALQAYARANTSEGLTPELRAYIGDQTQNI